MIRDILLAVGAMAVSLALIQVWWPLVLHGEVHGYECSLLVRTLEFLPPILVLGLSVERFITWLWRFYARRDEEA